MPKPSRVGVVWSLPMACFTYPGYATFWAFFAAQHRGSSRYQESHKSGVGRRRQKKKRSTMGGDAVREAERAQLGGVPAQCSLHTIRNLARDASLTPADMLANGNCMDDDIRFPHWAGLLEPLMHDNEEFVAFNPTRVPSKLLRYVRLSARVRSGSAHVTALVRDDSCAGEPAFRHYDNEGGVRLRGTFERVSLREAWVNCMMMAVVAKQSPLQRALTQTGWVRGQGDTRSRRRRGSTSGT